MDCIELAEDRDKSQALVSTVPSGICPMVLVLSYCLRGRGGETPKKTD